MQDDPVYHFLRSDEYHQQKALSQRQRGKGPPKKGEGKRANIKKKK
jgi:hypothetical protein